MRMRGKDQTVILHRTPGKKEKNERRGRHTALFCEKIKKTILFIENLLKSILEKCETFQRNICHLM